MERIVLEVDDNVAKAWRTASVKLKQEIGGVMNQQIAAIIDKKEETDIISAEYWIGLQSAYDLNIARELEHASH